MTSIPRENLQPEPSLLWDRMTRLERRLLDLEKSDVDRKLKDSSQQSIIQGFELMLQQAQAQIAALSEQVSVLQKALIPPQEAIATLPRLTVHQSFVTVPKSPQPSSPSARPVMTLYSPNKQFLGADSVSTPARSIAFDAGTPIQHASTLSGTQSTTSSTLQQQQQQQSMRSSVALPLYTSSPVVVHQGPKFSVHKPDAGTPKQWTVLGLRPARTDVDVALPPLRMFSADSDTTVASTVGDVVGAWNGTSGAGNVSCLQKMCVKVVAARVERWRSVRSLPAEVCEAIIVELGRQQRLTEARLQLCLHPELAVLDLSRAAKDKPVAVSKEFLYTMIDQLSTNLKRVDFSGWELLDGGIFQKLAERCPLLVSVVLSGCALVRDEHIRALVTRCTALEELVLDGCGQLTSVSLSIVGVRCSALKHMNMARCTGVGDKAVAAFSSCRTLEVLNVSGCWQLSDTALGVLAEGCTTLRDIDVSNCVKVTSKGIQALARNCPGLVRLWLSGCKYVQSDAFEKGTLVGLRSLNVSDTGVTAAAFEQLGGSLSGLVELFADHIQLSDRALHIVALNSGSRLRTLHIASKQSEASRRPGGVTDISIAALTQYCTSLESLVVNNRNELTDTAMRAVAQSMPLLRVLEVSACSLLTDQSVLELAQSLSVITRLNLKKCQFSDATVTALSNSLPRLTSLNLTGVTKISDAMFVKFIARRGAQLLTLDLSRTPLTDRAVTEIGLTCKKLVTLRIAGCERVRDTSLGFVLRQCGALHTLDVSSCPMIGNETTDALSFATALRVFYINNCSMLTDEAFSRATTLPPLTSVSLNACVRVGAAAIVRLVQLCPTIRTLNMAECAVTDQGLVAVAKACSQLRALQVTHTKHVTVQSVSSVVQACPFLQSLRLEACEEIDDNALKVIARYAHSLSALNVSFCIRITSAGVTHLLQNRPTLRRVKLEGCHAVEEYLRKSLSI
eukprot:TRINITY_DN6614_c0_g1_i1.p1 TRINITY_DN6614_c0_g1~~TRINITY_DN6614_c0_g1_i1.p1  ORF type:complete len:961 (+),score=271.34 TRINITY_DN6614_c0_g1_i1:93-2975(+)